MKKIAIIGAFLTAVSGLAAVTQPASAGTNTATFQVSITITKDCGITTAPKAIVISPTGAIVGSTGTTTFGITCTSGVPYTVQFLGASDQPDGFTHKMKSTTLATAAYIPYQLFDTTLDPQSATPLGTISTNQVSAKGTGVEQSNTLQAKVTAYTGPAAPDIYNDTVTLTLGF
jgi:spore coat protein U-like protein